MRLHDQAVKVCEIRTLDAVVEPISTLVARLLGHGAAKDALSGAWLGHPLHPLLTDIPIGSFTSASLLDLLGGRFGRRGADRLVAVGLVASIPTAAAGLSDWSDTRGADRRIGLVHASANLVGLGLYAASLVARRRGHRVRGASLGLLGMGVMTVGGYLGGHLSYSRGVGVNNAFWQQGPEGWTPVLDEAALPLETPVRVEDDDATVLLFRTRDRIHAIGSRCSHAGGPLEEGDIDATNECVTCPWHQSVFRLRDGAVVHGPARTPQATYAVRIEGGKVEIRRAGEHA